MVLLHTYTSQKTEVSFVKTILRYSNMWQKVRGHPTITPTVGFFPNYIVVVSEFVPLFASIIATTLVKRFYTGF